MVTAGGGGVIVGQTEDLHRLKHLSSTARVSGEYDHDMVGYNYRMTNIQAAVGCAQLERAEEFVARKRDIRRFYNEAFGGRDDITLFPTPAGMESVCWYSGIVLKHGGIESVKDHCGEDAGKRHSESLKVADGLWDRIVTLPCSTGITDDELQTGANTLSEIL